MVQLPIKAFFATAMPPNVTNDPVVNDDASVVLDWLITPDIAIEPSTLNIFDDKIPPSLIILPDVKLYTAIELSTAEIGPVTTLKTDIPPSLIILPVIPLYAHT